MDTVSDGGYLEHVEDIGWDVPPQEDGGRYTMLQDTIVDKGYAASLRGAACVYLNVHRFWMPLICRESSVRLCNLVEIKNATVNGMSAISGYVSWLSKRCYNNSVLPMQTSVCIGTQRLEVVLVGRDAIELTRSRSLVSISEGADQSATGFCILPVDTTIVPQFWRDPGSASMFNYLRPLFTHKEDMQLLMWHVGNCLVDPMRTPRCLLLAGRGGGGKSEVLNTIMIALGLCCSLLPDGTLTSNRTAVEESTLMRLSGSRMSLCYNVDLENRALDC